MIFVWLTSMILMLLVLAVSVPIAVLAVECGAAIQSRVKVPILQKKNRPRICILIPAHNEASVIGVNLEGILSQTQPQDSVVVVADNCTDNTAEIAQHLGVTVIERNNSQQKGKGYALDYGLKFIATKVVPEVVIILDADCSLGPKTIEKIGFQAQYTNKPVQALYLMKPPYQPSPQDLISVFAFLLKNWVRPLGLSSLGQPCLLTGSGMAIPWSAIAKYQLNNDNLTEDMQLGLDLAIAGYSPQFCGHAKVISHLPKQANAKQTQKTRWEHGHLKTIYSQVPRLLRISWQKKRIDLLVLALEISIPPLSLLVFLWIGIFTFTLLEGIVTGFWFPFILIIGSGIILTISIFSVWAKFGYKIVTFSQLLAIPVYLLWKIPVYLKFLISPQKQWIKTQR